MGISQTITSSSKWIYKKGETYNSIAPRHFGPKGVPDIINQPGSRKSAMVWRDASGNPWVMGGRSRVYFNYHIYFNDLWKYDKATDDWTWMKGDNRMDGIGFTGLMGVPGPDNNPISRDKAATWTDNHGNFWLYGGFGMSRAEFESHKHMPRNDLWKFNPVTNEWTWVKGVPNTYHFMLVTPVYGTRGVAHNLNEPGGRFGAATWTDASGKLWLFGGNTENPAAGTPSELYNDLWMFDPETQNWTWMKGAASTDAAGSYGSFGVAAASNTPGARSSAMSWTDGESLWLMGGYGFDGSGSGTKGYLNDLWRYDISTGMWTWIKGGNSVESLAIYGLRGIEGPTTRPGSRRDAVAITDDDGNFWLFGGFGHTGSGEAGHLNDLWKYNRVSNRWTWISGSNLTNQLGNYGIRWDGDEDNVPGGRMEACGWADNDGKLWIMSGSGYDQKGYNGDINDLMMFDPTNGEWTWVNGYFLTNLLSYSLTDGSADIMNTPGARMGSSGWTDTDGNLWLLGGRGGDFNTYGSYSVMNDLWVFSPVTNNWIFRGGGKLANDEGDYGVMGVPAASNFPRARAEAASWKDRSGKFWLFGGEASGDYGRAKLDDIWRFDPTTGLWTWMDGRTGINNAPVFGTRGVPHPANSPGGRSYTAKWSDAAGNLWVFGGTDHSGMHGGGSYSDLWKYDITTGNWTWMTGPNTLDVPGVFGTMGVAATTNNPPPREGGTTWTDNDGKLWLMGGDGLGFANFLHDMWCYDPATNLWTWVKGTSERFVNPEYGTIDVPDPADFPGGRIGALTWTDANGDLILYGGFIYDGGQGWNFLSDLWKYNKVTNIWTWIKGDNEVQVFGDYLGQHGVTVEKPGGRAYATTWKDNLGALWFFGGQGYTSNEGPLGTNDMWRLTPADLLTCYRDNDGDGHGDAARTSEGYSCPAGYVSSNDDCNDNNNTIYPGAVEICGNGIDENCSGKTDDDPCMITPEMLLPVVRVPEAVAQAVLTVTLNRTSDKDVMVEFITIDGSALSKKVNGQPADYEATFGKLQIKAGSSSGKIVIPVYKDGVKEAEEYFKVLFSNPQHVKLKTDIVEVFIVDDGAGQKNAAGVTSQVGVAKEASEKGNDNLFEVMISPNPSNNMFTVQLRGNNQEPMSVQVFDVNGKLKEKLAVAANSVIQVGGLYPAGVYVINVVQGKEQRVVKVVKQ
ncbi:hypothetical protein FPE01S_02_02100 [Flavihumibacter petaseus NBRC 106054]|uniref:Secretion system C-terminal sorting domain-containing protein n=2 Tax=Flavihumibacter TaxID=1004301 RepID=A0A0E9N0F0_9BACT|nr:hypothetical protein FPE01S_02_02100 [Flavihumibacter petaseus NBRC 106054]